MRDDAVQPVSDLEQERIPLMVPYPGTAATGARWDETIDPGDEPVGLGGDDAALPAEEAAMHLTSEDDAPGLSWDDSPGYLDVDERS